MYGAVLAVTLWQRSGQFWRVLAVPAAVYVLGTLLRAAINRPRPYEALNFTPLFPKDTKGQSMPSRHCFSAAAIVAAAFTVWVPLGVAACLLAAVVAVTRVLTGGALPQRRTGWPGLWRRGGCDRLPFYDMRMITVKQYKKIIAAVAAAAILALPLSGCSFNDVMLYLYGGDSFTKEEGEDYQTYDGERKRHQCNL